MSQENQTGTTTSLSVCSDLSQTEEQQPVESKSDSIQSLPAIKPEDDDEKATSSSSQRGGLLPVDVEITTEDDQRYRPTETKKHGAKSKAEQGGTDDSSDSGEGRMEIRLSVSEDDDSTGNDDDAGSGEAFPTTISAAVEETAGDSSNGNI